MTKTSFDSILVVTDRFTKYGYFIPYKESFLAEDLAYMFNKYIIRNHGIPKKIISDKNKFFTSKFWKSLIDQLGIYHKMSTGYHPQTDGQTERLNQTLEQYLRHYVNYQQDDWVVLLPTAQLAYNLTSTSTTGISPFFANYGYNPSASLKARGMVKVAEKAKVTVEKLKDLYQELTRDIEWISLRFSLYYNSKRLEGPRLREGDQVYLLRRNVKTVRPSDKLDHKKLGPFKIIRNIKDISFELQFPPTMRIYPVFHILFLESADPNIPQGPAPEIHPDSQEFEDEVEKILDVRKSKGRLQWLVKWLGYGNEHNTWESKINLTHCEEAKQEFYSQNPGKSGKD